MGEGHVVGDVLADLCLDVGNVLEETRGHTDQGLMRPGVEPVEDSAVHQPGELARTDAELVSHRAEAQGEVEVLTDLVDEEVPAILRSVNDARLLDLTAHRVTEAVLVFGSEELRDLSRREEVVDVNEHALLHDLVVRHQEGNRGPLHTSLLVQAEEVLLEVVDPVGAGDLHLEELVPADECRESSKTLLTRAAHAHEHGIALGEVNDARDAGYMLDRLVEQHQVHDGIALVVLLQLVLEGLLELGELVRTKVDRLFLSVERHEVRVDEGLLFHSRHVEVLEVLFGDCGPHLGELGHVLL